MLWADLVPKRLELLVKAVPELKRVVVVVVTSEPKLLMQIHREIPEAARQLPVAVSIATVDDLPSLEKQIRTMAAEKRVAMVLTAEPVWWPHRSAYR